MKKFLTGALAAMSFSSPSYADEFEFWQSGLGGLYYGVMETRDDNNIANLPNRGVFRLDGKLEGAYKYNNGTRLGLHGDYTVVYRQHDKSYDKGDWRFYPYALAEHKNYGKLTIGYTYNAAYILHQGAQDISWLGIQDSNLTYFLSSANWVNGLSSVKFATPKSSHILDDGRAAKFSYFTPEIGNTRLGFSYTPDNANRRGLVSRYVNYETTQDGYTAGMQNKWDVGLGTLYTSAAYGLFNRTDNEWAFGLRWKYKGLSMSTSYKKAYIEGHKNPISTTAQNSNLPAYFDNYRESQVWDFSIGYDFGAFKTNLAYLHAQAENTRHRDDLFVQTNRYTLNKYFDLFWINAYINSKGIDRASDNNNKGYAIVTGIALKY